MLLLPDERHLHRIQPGYTHAPSIVVGLQGLTMSTGSEQRGDRTTPASHRAARRVLCVFEFRCTHCSSPAFLVHTDQAAIALQSAGKWERWLHVLLFLGSGDKWDLAPKLPAGTFNTYPTSIGRLSCWLSCYPVHTLSEDACGDDRYTRCFSRSQGCSL
jgi:hypothetical protein